MKFIRIRLLMKFTLKFSQWMQCFLMKKVIKDYVMDAQFELQHMVVAEFK